MRPHTVLRPAQCWGHDAIPGRVLCAESVATIHANSASKSRKIGLLRRLGEAMALDEQSVCAYLQHLSPEERYDLLQSAVPDLRTELQRLLGTMGAISVRERPRTVRIPEELPAHLAQRLHEYYAKVTARYERLIKNGHSRSSAYQGWRMNAPIRLAKYLAANGIERWDVLRQRDIASFLMENPGLRRSSLDGFLHFLNQDRSFTERRGRPPSKLGRKRTAPRPPPVISPSELKLVITEIRRTRSPAEFLLAWLVCRMGMTAAAGYALTLDKIRVDNAGRLVIQPARVWVAVPRDIEPMLLKLISDEVPDWRQIVPEQLQHVTIFDRYIKDIGVFREQVLQGRALTLRASAVFAAMHNGHLDRATLHATMGVSMPTIAKLELLLSADLHRRLDPSIVAGRNAAILGEADD
jgi:hypothetical protein